MRKYKTDGHVVTNGESSMGIFSTVELLNQYQALLAELDEYLEYKGLSEDYLKWNPKTHNINENSISSRTRGDKNE